jgi:hypothetical protein
MPRAELREMLRGVRAPRAQQPPQRGSGDRWGPGEDG